MKITLQLLIIFAFVSSCTYDLNKCVTGLNFGELKVKCYQHDVFANCDVKQDVKLYYCYRPVLKTHTSGPATGNTYWEFDYCPEYYTCDEFNRLPAECFINVEKRISSITGKPYDHEFDGLYPINENTRLFKIGTNLRGLTWVGTPYTAEEAIKSLPPYNTVDPDNYALFFTNSCTDYTKNYFRKKSVPFPYVINGDACTEIPDGRADAEAQEEIVVNNLFLEGKCDNPGFTDHIYVDASSDALNRDIINGSFNRPLPIGLAIEPFDPRRVYYIDLTTKSGAQIDRINIVKPISGNEGTQKIKYYQTKGNALQATALSKIYSTQNDELVATLNHLTNLYVNGVPQPETIGSPLSIPVSTSQPYPIYTVPTPNGITQATSSARVFNIRYNPNPWMDFSGQEIKDKVNLVFNDGGEGDAVMNAHIRTDFKAIKTTETNRLDWLIDADNNILIEYQYLDEHGLSGIQIDKIETMLYEWALSLVANFVDYSSAVSSAKGNCSNTSLAQCKIAINAKNEFSVSNNLRFENLAYLMVANKIKIVNRLGYPQDATVTAFETIEYWQNVADCYVYGTRDPNSNDNLFNGSFRQQAGITLRADNFGDVSGDLKYDVPPVCVVFRGAFAGMNKDQTVLSEKEINELTLLTTCHELGHAWSMDMLAAYEKTDALKAHNGFCNGFNKNNCLFRYFKPQDFINISEKSVDLEKLANLYRQHQDAFSFCEGHRQILINRLCVQNRKNKDQQ